MRYPPFTHPSQFYKERDFGRKIEACFDFLKAHFRPLGQALLYLVLPVALLTGIASGLMQARMIDSIRQMQNPDPTARSRQFLSGLFLSPQYWGALVGSLLTFALLTLVVYGYLVLRANRPDPAQPVTVADVWAVVRRRFLGLLGSLLGLTLLVIGGMMLTTPLMALAAVVGGTMGKIGTVFLVVFLLYGAGFYLSVTLSLYPIVWLLEGRGFFGSIGRCFRLIYGKWWSTFGLLVVMGLLVLVLVLAVMLATSLISSPLALLRLESTPEPVSQVANVTAACIQSVASIVIYPLLLLAPAFQYFNLVERKEGQSLHLLVDSLGQTLAPAAPHAVRPDDEGEY